MAKPTRRPAVPAPTAAPELPLPDVKPVAPADLPEQASTPPPALQGVAATGKIA